MDRLSLMSLPQFSLTVTAVLARMRALFKPSGHFGDLIAMQAVFVTGGKQYRVSQGDKIRVESLNVEPGDAVDFDQVLMLADGDKSKIGAPTVKGGKVSAKVVANGRAKKVEIIKFRRRKHHMKRQGHRQNFTEIEITGISG